MQDDSTLPATKGDIRALVKVLNERFTRIDERFSNMEDHIDKVLAVLGNVNTRLTGRIDNHEVRIKHLEKVTA